jgi:hypothetical protein
LQRKEPVKSLISNDAKLRRPGRLNFEPFKIKGLMGGKRLIKLAERRFALGACDQGGTIPHRSKSMISRERLAALLETAPAGSTPALRRYRIGRGGARQSPSSPSCPRGGGPYPPPSELERMDSPGALTGCAGPFCGTAYASSALGRRDVP